MRNKKDKKFFIGFVDARGVTDLSLRKIKKVFRDKTGIELTWVQDKGFNKMFSGTVVNSLVFEQAPPRSTIELAWLIQGYCWGISRA